MSEFPKAERPEDELVAIGDSAHAITGNLIGVPLSSVLDMSNEVVPFDDAIVAVTIVWNWDWEVCVLLYC